MFPKREETRGAMYEERSSVLRKGQSLIDPKSTRFIRIVRNVWGQTSCSYACSCVCVWEGRVVCTEANGSPGLNTTRNGSVAQSRIRCFVVEIINAL